MIKTFENVQELDFKYLAWINVDIKIYFYPPARLFRLLKSHISVVGCLNKLSILSLDKLWLP
jgi:hypothetical protein